MLPAGRVVFAQPGAPARAEDERARRRSVSRLAAEAFEDGRQRAHRVVRRPRPRRRRGYHWAPGGPFEAPFSIKQSASASAGT